MSDDRISPGLGDSLLLVVVVLLSVLPYVGGLGFYSDDWHILGEFVNARDQSFGNVFESLWDHRPTVGRRPTQVLYQATLYSWFGLRPLGYHVTNGAVLAGMAVALYWALREFGTPRWFALATSLVYVTLPNYSANRFWFAAFGYPLTMACWFLAIFADFRGSGRPWPGCLVWKLVALTGVVVSGLAYEIVLPLLIVHPALVWLQVRRRRVTSTAPDRWRPIVVYGSHALAVALILAFKSRFPQGVGFVDGAEALTRLAATVMIPNLVTYGVGLPCAAAWALGQSGLAALACAAAAAALVATRLLRAIGPADAALLLDTPRRRWLHLAGLGVIILGLGYAVFIGAVHRLTIGSSSFGNRIAMVGALGATMLFIAGGGWLSSVTRSLTVSRYVFTACVTAVVASGILVNAALAEHHVHAWARQQAILTGLRTALPVPERGTTVILTGECPFVGGAMVFGRYDLEGALWVVYRDKSLKGDVATRVAVTEKGLELRTADFHETYVYESRLLVYDARRRDVTALPDRQRALDRFGAATLGWPVECPPGTLDMGSPIFPADRIFLRWLPEYP